MNSERAAAYPPMPPEPPALQEAYTAQRNELRRQKRYKIGRLLGSVTIAGLLSMQPISDIDNTITNIKYPASSMEVSLVDGAKDMPDGGLMYIAFPGAGQQSSKNAATELFNAADGKFKVAYVALPNQGFTIEQLAQKTEKLLAETQPDELGVEGVSMGTKLGLATLSTVQDNASESYYRAIDGAQSDIVQGNRKLPNVSYFLALGSPYDLGSANQGELVQGAVGLMEQFHIQPGLRLKFIYSMLNSEADVDNALNIFNRTQWINHVVDSLKETFNDTPPAMVKDQLEILATGTNEGELSKVLSPDITQFIYYYPGNGSDAVVNNNQAYRQFAVALQKLYVTTEYTPTNSTEHADTVAAADAFGAYIRGQQESLEQATNEALQP